MIARLRENETGLELLLYIFIQLALNISKFYGVQEILSIKIFDM